MNKPFTVFVCDHCKRLVKPEDAMLLWNCEWDEEGNHFLKDCTIVHNNTRCEDKELMMSAHLEEVVNNPAFWLERMRLYGEQTEAKMDGDWLECMARCLVPYYEEARPYIRDYENDGYEFKFTKHDCEYVLRWVNDKVSLKED